VSQFKVLSLLQRHNRALICGPAGTGKTFLALEKARRLAEDNNNFKVLLVCFNIRLAEKLRELTNECTNVDVYHFHGLCSYFCKKANIAIPQPDPLVSNENYFKYDLPESLMNALCYTDERYDALIVDEGQDFDPAWWIPLEEVLRNPRSDIFYFL
jgi:superfamily I DNA and RNA helicase